MPEADVKAQEQAPIGDIGAVITEQMQRTVRQLPEGYTIPTTALILQVAITADEAPTWWAPDRDLYLRSFWRGEPFLASAIYSLCARNAGFRWEIEASDEIQKQHAIRLLDTAEFGEGWSELVLKVSEDLYTQDNGGFIEVIRPARAKVNGKVYRAIARRHRRSQDIDWFAIMNRFGGLKQVTPEQVSDSPLDLPIGLAHLDANKCTRTGEPDKPVRYMDRYGMEHDLMAWQVITLADMPSPIEEMHSVGFCMVSRVLRLAQTIRDWQIYRQEKISGRFARAVHLTNVDADLISDAIEKAMARADELGMFRYTQPIVTNTLDPSARPEIATIQLASLPDGFTEDEAMRWYVAALALAAGEHYSFFAPMPGRRLGSAREVEVQERQARGKSSRLWMEAITTKFHNACIFAPGCKLVFKEKDPEEQAANEAAAARRAETRSLRIASGEITPEIARQIALDEGDLKPDYLQELGETDVTPEDGGDVIEGSVTEVGGPAQIAETTGEVTFGQKQEGPQGRPPKPWGDKSVPITKEDIARALGKWDERMPPEARGILRARPATEEEELEAGEEPEVEEKGGPDSGYHAPHYGRPGEIGGSSPRRGFDEAAERDLLMVVQGQSSKPKPGVTRAQTQRFYDRRNATNAAAAMRYREGGTAKEEIDEAVARGLTKVKTQNRWTVLSNEDGSDALRFRSKVERDYIDVVLDRGSFAMNYGQEEKGGPGSGHFRHPGRPGKVGGSTPTGRAPVVRGARRPAAAEPEVSVGITSDRPGKTREQVWAEMRAFVRRMEAIGVKNLKVVMGRGGWEGGGEATWVTSFDGDGEAKRIIIETAKQYDQDAVLLMYRAEEGAEGVTPKTSFRFGGILSDQEITRIEQELVERKIGGWTWYNGKQGSTLMMACVAQWGCESDTHQGAMADLLADVDLAGYGITSQTGWLRNEVFERDDYDRFLSGEA